MILTSTWFGSCPHAPSHSGAQGPRNYEESCSRRPPWASAQSYSSTYAAKVDPNSKTGRHVRCYRSDSFTLVTTSQGTRRLISRTVSIAKRYGRSP